MRRNIALTEMEYLKVRAMNRAGRSLDEIVAALDYKMTPKGLYHHMKRLGVYLRKDPDRKVAHHGAETTYPDYRR